MKKAMACALCLLLILGCGSLAACAEEDAAARYCGTWVAEGVTVEIRPGEGGVRCRAVFQDDEGLEYELWEYGTCWYDAEEDLLRCLSVTKTQYRRADLWAEPEETDWSLSDMYLGEFRFAESGTALIWTDESFEAPVELAPHAFDLSLEADAFGPAPEDDPFALFDTADPFGMAFEENP